MDDYLSLPISLSSNGALGLDARLSQLIVQWARTRRCPTLVLPESADNELNTISNLALSSYGLTALALAKEIQKSDGTVVPQKQIRAVINKRLNTFNSRDINILIKSEGISFLSIYDHPLEFGDWLFTKNPVDNEHILQTPSQISSWLTDVLSHMLPNEFQDLFDDQRRATLSIAAYELLENANLHGRCNEYAEPLRAGVFGITARVIRVSYDTIGPLFQGAERVGVYFLERVIRDKAKQDLFLELSIFDSGIGYHNWINAPCNANTSNNMIRNQPEDKTVRACLFRHATSKTADGAGVGLFRVIRLLKQLFGFIRIRTGTTCLYARLDQTSTGDLRKLGARYDDSENNEVFFKDWFSTEQLPESAGTTVTICCPLTSWR